MLLFIAFHKSIVLIAPDEKHISKQPPKELCFFFCVCFSSFFLSYFFSKDVKLFLRFLKENLGNVSFLGLRFICIF